MTTEAERLAKWISTYYDPWDAPKEILLVPALLRQQAAEIKRLKTMPMKYRRMTFNAELQTELDKANTLLRQTLKALVELETRCKEVKTELRVGIPDGEPVHPLSARLTWPMSTAIGAIATIKQHLGEDHGN